MRGTVDGLGTAVPIADLLPAILQEDGFAVRLTAGLDDVVAPVFTVLDCLDAYVDPSLCPADFLDWLATWVGVVLDEHWPIERQRMLVASAVELYRIRGTAAGLQAELEIITDGVVEIVESGGTVWSATPHGDLPGQPAPRLAVRVTTDESSTVLDKALHAVVTAAKPAHVVHRVEIVTTDAVGQGDPT